MINSLPNSIVQNAATWIEHNPEKLQGIIEQQKLDPSSVANVKHAAEEFEGVFVSMLIKQMRETLQDGLFSGETSDSYGAIFDLYMGKHLAESSPLGVGAAVKAYLQGSENAEPDATKTRGTGTKLPQPSDQ